MRLDASKTFMLLAATALIGAPGCASKKYVDEGLSTQSERIQSLESGLEENQRRVKDVEGNVAQVDSKAARAQKTGDEALAAAGSASKTAQQALDAARVKLLLEVTLSEDLTAFRSDHSQLPDGAIPALDQLAKQILDTPAMVHVEIHGHTDSRGAEAWNLDLGQRRADSVARYLNERGVPLYVMSTISHGSSQPLADNSSKEGRSQNRRVVVRVHELYED